MKDWKTIDFKKVQELLDAYDVCLHLANDFQMFDSPDVRLAMGDIREAIRLEVDGKPLKTE